MRRAFLNRMNELIPVEEDLVYLTVDIGMWAMRGSFKNYKQRCMNFGIFEDGMISMAAGMASRGLLPIIFGIQPYLIERTLEQIKMDLAYQKLPVKVIGTGAAVDYSKYGYSHYCAEDVGVIKQIPGIQFIAPGTSKQFLQLFNQSYRNQCATFYRISDHPNVVYDPDVTFGNAEVMKRGKGATVIAISTMLDSVMDACKNLDVTVLYYTTLEPFDKETLAYYAENGKILVAEPEYKGTFLQDIHDALPNRSLDIRQVGFPREIFRNYGTYQEKMQYYKLTADAIRKELIELIQ